MTEPIQWQEKQFREHCKRSYRIFCPTFTRLYAIECMISVTPCSFRLCPVLQLRYIRVDFGLHGQKNIAAALWLLVFFKCAAETGSAWACRAEIMLSCKLWLEHEISPSLLRKTRINCPRGSVNMLMEVVTKLSLGAFLYLLRKECDGVIKTEVKRCPSKGYGPQ